MKTHDDVIAWLEAHPGVDPPEETDLAVLSEVYTDRPDLVPAPRLEFSDVFDAVSTGPLRAPTQNWRMPVAVLALAAALVLVALAWQGSSAVPVVVPPIVVPEAVPDQALVAEGPEPTAPEPESGPAPIDRPTAAEMEALEALGYIDASEGAITQ